MDISRTTLKNVIELYGINLAEKDFQNLNHFQELRSTVSPEQKLKARCEFLNNGKERTTPRCMSQLLERIFNAEIVSIEHRDLMLKFMRNCKTFKSRLPGLLPEGTLVARKTGTIDHHANDVGIITLPHNRGNIVISVYIKQAEQPAEKLNRTIAEISRTIYDYFLLRAEFNNAA